MSLFRRPKKAVRPRVITINADEEDDEMDDLPPPIVPPVPASNGNVPPATSSTSISTSTSSTSQAIVTKAIKKENVVSDRKQTLLSFDEELEGDDGEIFKVKKSSVSRRLIKQRGKEKKSDWSSSSSNSQKVISGNNVSVSKVKSEVENEVGSTTDEKPSDDNFIRVLNGREAEAVHLEEEDVEEEDDELQVSVRFRSTAQRDAASEAVRMALERGQIPDANLIHEARRRRQMAREFSSNAPEFIPLDSSQKYRSNQSRLVRDDDDDNDRSGDEDEQRINFSTATNAARIDRDKRREVFDAAQDEERDIISAGESDPEIDEWEKQQIRKGVTQSQMQSVVKEVFQQQPYIYSADTQSTFSNYTAGSYYDPASSVYPNYPSPRGIQSTSSDAIRNKNSKDVDGPKRVMNVDEIVTGSKKMTPDMVISVLEDNLNKLKLSKEAHEGSLSRMEADLKLADDELLEAKAAKPALSSRFILYQNLRGYVTDLVDCLRCKVPVIEALENQMLELMKSRMERLAERRRQDMKDQLEEVKATFNIMSSIPVTVPPPSLGEAKSRRAAEREGRRTRRRRLREIKDYRGHKEGLSSDDEETELELNSLKVQKEMIINQAEHLFDDVVEDFGTIDGILSRFEEWKHHDFDSYKESYAFMCVPKCLAPLIRIPLLCWDPFTDGFNMLKFSWIKSLATFGAQEDETIESLSADPDSRLIPEVAEKILVPWITRVVEAKWDPMSASQTKKIVNVTRRCIDEWSVVPTCKSLQSLMSSIVIKFKDAVDSDVFIPLFPKTVMVNKCSPAYCFASRQFWSAVKLLDNMSSWAGLLNDKPLHILALDALLTRYILLGLRTAPDLSDSAERAKGLVNVMPRTWLTREQDKEVPNGLQQLTSCLISVVQNTDFAMAVNRVAIREVASVLKSIGAVDEAQLVIQKYS